MTTRVVLALWALATAALANEAPPPGSFDFAFSVELPGRPVEMYDALTGDVSGWWGHSTSGDRYALEIQTRPGGHFLETFDTSGDGVVHAVVTHAHRDER